MRQEIIKLIGIFFVLLIIVALILFIIGKINAYWFWLIVIISAVVAYKILPGLKAK